MNLKLPIVSSTIENAKKRTASFYAGLAWGGRQGDGSLVRNLGIYPSYG